MSSRKHACVWVFALLPFFGALAQETSPDTEGAPELRPLAFMANSCWEGPLPGFVATSPDAGPEILSHCLRWTLGGHALRDTLWIEGASPPVRGETTYYWDRETQTLRYIFWSITGSYSVGTVKTDGAALIFDDERLVGRSGIIHFHTTWTQTGPDSYVQDRRRQGTDGNWTESTADRFVRKPLK